MTIKRLFIAGQNGMVGHAILDECQKHSTYEVINAPRSVLNLSDSTAVQKWFERNKPDAVIMAAGRVGGIAANAAYPVDFLLHNTMMAINVIESARQHGVQKLIYLGSSCMYPRDAPQPLHPHSLLSGAFEPTNEAYALAKMVGLKLCSFMHQQYRMHFFTLIPCNLYGPHDRFDCDAGHVIPALMTKAHEAAQKNHPSMIVWGSGQPMREFLHVQDLARAVMTALQHYEGTDPINVGSGEEISIAALVRSIAKNANFKGDLVFDSTRPDGVMRKVLDSALIRSMGWRPGVSLQEGLMETYAWYVANHSALGCAA